MEELTQNNRIEGTVTAILFRNEENGYTVLRLDGGERGEITAVGSMPGVSPGISATGPRGAPCPGTGARARCSCAPVPWGIR